MEGRIQTGSYTNRDGQRVYTTDVVVENIEFAESKATAGANGNGYVPFDKPSAGPENGGYVPFDRPSPSGAAGDGFMNLPDGIDEDLPFN